MVGVYISVPFCKAKCTYCNFASGVFAAGRMASYVDRLCSEIEASRTFAIKIGAELPSTVDTVFFGGGTPSLLLPEHFERIFAALRGGFAVARDAEITVECAPGQMPEATLERLLELGMSRLSFGVQSFVDAEAQAVGRLHTGAMCRAEIDRMHAAGVRRVNVDLIAGLPHQNMESWRYSLGQMVESGASHGSVYMLEVDEDSRLGRELIGEGVRYGAGLVPEEAAIAAFYGEACAALNDAGIVQYEISNFARTEEQSCHNLKYWRRDAYIGFGLDAHSMLLDCDGRALRFANEDDLDAYMESTSVPEVERVDAAGAFAETVFLGLRLNEGLRVKELHECHDDAFTMPFLEQVVQMESGDMVTFDGERVRLTERGRLVSNSVFTELLAVPA